VKKYNAAVIGLAYDDKGISDDPEVRLAAVKTIVDAAAEYGIGKEDIVIDCLAFSIGTNHRAAAICLETMRQVKKEYDLNMVLGVSNVSFGVPNRSDVNTIFLSQCMACGLTSGIINPMDTLMMKAALATELVLGRDRHCRNWNTFYRRSVAQAETAKA
jgi:5-methyltetrahydrofolate--homocysteine methyltransferase